MRMAERAAEIETDDVGECAFWFQVERDRVAPAKSDANNETEQELKREP